MFYLIALAIFTLVVNSPQTSGSCDGYGWTENEANCFKLITLKMTFTEARGVCRRQGADLVSIHSREEQEFLRKMIAPDYRQLWLLQDSNDSLKYIWIGMRRVKMAGNSEGYRSVWVDGSIVEFGYAPRNRDSSTTQYPWATGQPSK